MADIKFSQLPNLGTITGTTIVPVVDSLTNYTVTAANLQTYVNTSAGAITAASLSVSGNVVGANVNTGGNVLVTGVVCAVGNVRGGNINTAGIVNATGNLLGGNVITGGFITATGNITGNYILGNGSLLTGLPATYGNANVAAYLPTFTGNLSAGNISFTGNITGNGSRLSAITAGNIVGTVANAAYANTAGFATTAATANTATTASTAATAGTATTAGTVTTAAQPAITSVGTLTSLGVTGNVSVGNLTTGGNITAGQFIGNGSQLSGLVTSIVAGNGISVNSATGAVTVTATGSIGNAISNGTSNVVIASANGNIIMNTNGIEALRVAVGPGTSGVTRILTNGAVFSEGMFVGGDYTVGTGNINLYGTGEIQCKSIETSSGNVSSAGYVIGQALITSVPPATSTSTGIQGQLTWDSNYIYVCINANQWRRVALSAF